MANTDSTITIPADKDEALVDVLKECFRNYDVKSFVRWYLKEFLEDEIKLDRGVKYVVADTVQYFRKKGRLGEMVTCAFSLHSDDDKFIKYINSLPGDLPARLYRAAGVITPEHKYRDITTFDLVTTMQLSVHSLTTDQSVVGLAIACSTSPFPTCYCERLKEHLARSGPVQVLGAITLDKLSNDSSVVLPKMKRLKSTLAHMHVIAPLIIPASMVTECAAMWDDIKVFYQCAVPNRLIVPMFSSSDISFPHGVPVIPSPVFTDSDLCQWMTRLTNGHQWAEGLMAEWNQTCVKLCRTSDAIDVVRTYDHLEYVAENILLPPTEQGMKQLFADWSSSYATD
jgi:hypothetical protein